MWKLQFLIIIHISILFAYSQTENNFIRKLKLTVNDSTYYPDSTFICEVLKKVHTKKINYTISSVFFSEGVIRTKIKIPQTFNQDNVIKQCVLYYCLLNNEDDRKREYLEVYPFFESLKNKPWIHVKYQSTEVLNIWINNWKSIPVITKPSSIEAEIYNQVIDLSYKQSGVFDTANVKIFEEVAKTNDLHRSIVQEIYRKVLLWQKSQ